MMVLVISEEPDLRNNWKDELELEGHQAHEAEHGKDGLKVLENHPIDAVISEVSMPVMDGCSFLREARIRFPQLPIFMIRNSTDYSEKEILRLGANGCGDSFTSGTQKIMSLIKTISNEAVTPL